MRTFVCLRVIDCTYFVCSSVTKRCEECGEPISVSPSTIALREPLDELYCFQCFRSRSSPSTHSLMPLTDWQRRELRAAGVEVPVEFSQMPGFSKKPGISTSHRRPA